MRRPVMLLSLLLILPIITTIIACGDDKASPTPGATGTQEATPIPTIKPITLKLVTAALEGTPRGDIFFHFKDLVEECTNRRVMIDIYPGAQLFPRTEEWEAVVTGAVDIFADSTYYISQAVPDVMFSYMDGLWESYEQAYAALEKSELPQILRQKVEEAGPVKLLGILPGEMVGCILNSVRETKQLNDLDGLRCQSSPGSPSTAIYTYSGMVDVPIAAEEVSVAFIQGIVDAVQYTAGALTSQGLHETAKHALCRTAFFTAYAMLINSDSWESLPSEDRYIILNEVMPEMYDYAKTISRESEETSLELIEQEVETMHWITQEESDTYMEYSQTHPIYQVQRLMVDPRILEIVDELRPSKQ